MDDRIEEILQRLAALERRVDELSARGGEPEEASPCPFRTEERRIVDLVVELTAERVAQLLDAREGAPPSDEPLPGYGHHGPPQGPPHYGPAHYGPPQGPPHYGPAHHGPPHGHHHGPPQGPDCGPHQHGPHYGPPPGPHHPGPPRRRG